MRQILAISLLVSAYACGQSIPVSHYESLSWRCIGPFRGGRTVAAEGIPSRPNTFFVGVNDGGVWKTTDAGRTWQPIFDDQPTGSIGALAVAPSDSNVIYVGSGEGLQRPDLSVGDGMYRSGDGGKTWLHCGLTDGQQIAKILVHPQNPNEVLVAVLGHPYGPNAERGVFKTTDGGATWRKVLGNDSNTGAIALASPAGHPEVIYASMWASRQGPWENGSWQGMTSGLFKSEDNGEHWGQIKGGLPGSGEKLGRIGLTVAPGDPNCLYALVDATNGGLYRSDDAGKNWRLVNKETRIWGRGSDFAEVQVDPRDKETVLIANTSVYRSTNGGSDFNCIKGAPGGDDYHTIWINPLNPEIILLACDQGATISVNGGDTWSTWYNQPTAQFFHVATDNQVPYRVYGAQQESGSAGVQSRGADGQITFREWHPVGAEEYAYIAPDPKDPNIIYASKGSRYDARTGEVTDVRPAQLKKGGFRFVRTMPMLFSPTDPNVLFLASNQLFKTTNGGKSWDIVSPDLSRQKWDIPEGVGIFSSPDLATMKRRGVIYAVGPSYVKGSVIWAGTDDGLVWITRNGGKSWVDVTPPGVTSWSKIAQIDGSRFDESTAYVAVNRLRCDDLKPYLYVTHDFGKTWMEIVGGLPDNAPMNTIREDPKRKGLLFAGSERQVWFSANDGLNWNSLRLNMPATSIRDLVVHDDDLIIGTHGRSFWIMDSINALRDPVLAADTHLVAPSPAYEVSWNNNTDTPLPPEEVAGQNPPDGVALDYYLAKQPTSAISLEILDGRGKVVRVFKSDDTVDELDPTKLTVDPRWAKQPQVLSGKLGAHRFTWDLRSSAPTGKKTLEIAAIWRQTPASPQGVWVPAGKYTVRLTVDGSIYQQTMNVQVDPRLGKVDSDHHHRDEDEPW